MKRRTLLKGLMALPAVMAVGGIARSGREVVTPDNFNRELHLGADFDGDDITVSSHGNIRYPLTDSNNPYQVTPQHVGLSKV